MIANSLLVNHETRFNSCPRKFPKRPTVKHSKEKLFYLILCICLQYFAHVQIILIDQGIIKQLSSVYVFTGNVTSVIIPWWRVYIRLFKLAWAIFPNSKFFCFESTQIQQSATRLNINNFQKLSTLKMFFLLF